MAAFHIVSKSVKSSLMCKFNLKSSALDRISCDCASSEISCFDDIDEIPIGEQNFFSDLEGYAQWSGLSVSVSSDGVPPEQDSALIEASIVDTTTSTTNTRRRNKVVKSPYDPNEYEIITNHIDYIVGQILSAGVTLSIPENVTINVCIDIDIDIPKDPEMIYPTRDFAGYNASIPKWWPLNYNITVVGNDVQFCADISESGTYYAILRLNDWEYATGIAPTSVPTSIPTSVPTPAPTSVPTAPPTIAPVVSSGLSGVALVGIILGSLMLVVTLLAFLISQCLNNMGTGGGTRRRKIYAPDGGVSAPIIVVPRQDKFLRHKLK